MLDLKANPRVGLFICLEFYLKGNVELAGITYTEINTKTNQ